MTQPTMMNETVRRANMKDESNEHE